MYTKKMHSENMHSENMHSENMHSENMHSEDTEQKIDDRFIVGASVFTGALLGGVAASVISYGVNKSINPEDREVFDNVGATRAAIASIVAFTIVPAIFSGTALLISFAFLSKVDFKQALRSVLGWGLGTTIAFVETGLALTTLTFVAAILSAQAYNSRSGAKEDIASAYKIAVKSIFFAGTIFGTGALGSLGAALLMGSDKDTAQNQE